MRSLYAPSQLPHLLAKCFDYLFCILYVGCKYLIFYILHNLAILQSKGYIATPWHLDKDHSL